jgi:hypothetical protein
MPYWLSSQPGCLASLLLPLPAFSVHSAAAAAAAVCQQGAAAEQLLDGALQMMLFEGPHQLSCSVWCIQ